MHSAALELHDRGRPARHATLYGLIEPLSLRNLNCNYPFFRCTPGAACGASMERCDRYERASLRFTSLTRQSASRVGRGILLSSLTESVSRTAVFSDTRCPCDT